MTNFLIKEVVKSKTDLKIIQMQKECIKAFHIDKWEMITNFTKLSKAEKTSK